MKRLITLSYPKQKIVKLLEIEVKNETAYDLVEIVRKKQTGALELKSNQFAEKKIGDLIPIHNLSGVRDFSQIAQMQSNIMAGQEILEQGNFPNVKLIVVPNGKVLVFDGTHSLLAYYLVGKKNLGEIPYLAISSENYGAVTIEELLPFFSENARKQVKADWGKYVVNWQAETGNQLELRQVHSIAELASQFSKRNKSSVK